MPYATFTAAGYNISVATQHGAVPACDARMLTGWTQTFLGADKHTIDLYSRMIATDAWQHPAKYTEPAFTLSDFDLVFLAGGHDKGIRQLLDCPHAQKLLVNSFPLTQRALRSKPKYCAAVCHGVQLLAHSRDRDGLSVLRDLDTTALPSLFEGSISACTRLFLGDYYKTYGAGTDNVAEIVKASLADEGSQFKNSNSLTEPFVVEDKNYRYFSGRWPGDAKLLADMVVKAADSGI